jgi:hypothetical protein
MPQRADRVADVTPQLLQGHRHASVANLVFASFDPAELRERDPPRFVGRHAARDEQRDVLIDVIADLLVELLFGLPSPKDRSDAERQRGQPALDAHRSRLLKPHHHGDGGGQPIPVRLFTLELSPPEPR